MFEIWPNAQVDKISIPGHHFLATVNDGDEGMNELNGVNENVAVVEGT
jgi:hypothetical protein